jgi:hypothetical protein
VEYEFSFVRFHEEFDFGPHMRVFKRSFGVFTDVVVWGAGYIFVQGDVIALSVTRTELDLFMRTLNQAEVAQVAGAALDPKLGLFPKTGIALIDNIHAGEWKLYGKPLYNIFAPLLGAPKAA